MKLGELRSLIRKTKGNPSVIVGGLTLNLQKTPLLAELEKAFPGGKTTDTAIDYDLETGLMVLPGSMLAVAPIPAEGEPDDLDVTETLDDLAGGLSDDDDLLV